MRNVLGVLRDTETSKGSLWILFLAVCASGLLAWQAAAANRRHERSVKATLDGYAALAAWQYGRQAGQRLQHAVNMTVWPAVSLGTVSNDPLPPASILEGAAGSMADCDCPMPVAARYFFRLDLSGNELATTGEVPDSTASTDLRRAVMSRVGNRMSPSWRGMLAAPEGGSLAGPFVFAILPGPGGSARAAYGIGIEAAALAPTFREALETAALFPDALTGGATADSMVAVRILAPAGDTVFDSRPGWSSIHSARQTLGPDLGDLSVEVSLTEAGAGILGARPASGPWGLLSLLAATVGLFGMAVHQLRRESGLLALKGRFIAAVSHELRTPLTQIRLYSEALRLGRVRSETEREHFLDIVGQEAQRLTALVENVLRFHRSNGTGPGHPSDMRTEPTRLDHLTREVVETFEPLAEASGTALRTEIPRAVTAEVDADALRQVLLNLLDNACKHGGPDQTVRVRLSSDRGGVRLEVEDQGMGVPAAERHRIFRPLVRLNGTRSASSGGAGIGLAVVRDLVTGHGGRVWVEEAPLGGARFVVTLPCGRVWTTERGSA